MQIKRNYKYKICKDKINKSRKNKSQDIKLPLYHRDKDKI